MASNFDYDPAWKPEGQGSSSFDFDPNWTPPKKPEGGLVASLKQTGGQMVKSAGQLAADVLPGVDRDNALTRSGQGIIDANPTAVHSLADVADSPWTATKEAVGNAAASVGGVVGARLLGQGITAAAPLAGPAAPLVAGIGQGISWLGPTAMAALPSYGGIREQQIAADPNNEGSLASKALAGAGAATVGLIENRFGPQEWALKALSQGGRDALAKQFAANSLAGAIGKGAVKGAAIEGAEELVQNPIEQLASYQDPTTAANLQDTAFGGVMGALGGGVLGGGAGGFSRTITPSQAQQPAQPPQPAIDPNAGPLSKAASMATQTPELNPLAFTPMQPTGPELETDAQTQERLRAAQFQADAMPFEPSLSFEQGPQPVRAMNQEGVPFERISHEDYDTLNPIRAGEGELLDAERPTAGRTRAPDAIEGQAQRRIGVADDGQQGNQSPVRTLGERVQPAQGENAPTLALPYFTDQKAEQSARKALPFANEPAAQKKAAELSKKRNEPFTVIPHPALADRFAVVPFRNLRTPNEQGQAAQLAARAQAGQSGTMPHVEQGAQQSAPDGLAAPAPATAVQTQPTTESVTNGLPQAQKLAQEAEAARGQEGAKETTRRVTRDTSINDGATVFDRDGKPYRVHYQRNDLVVAHPIINGKPQVSADTTVRFWTNKDVPPSGERDRTDPIYPASTDISTDTITPNPTPAKAKAADTQFDVSARTDDQLRYLTVSGKPGWKEAAQSELARRQGAPQPQAPQSDQFGNANKMVEQPSTQQEGRREEVAPKPKNLLQLVRKAGGVSMNRLSDVTGDNNPRRAGAVGVFTKKGMDLDSLAELLQQNGFMTEAEVSDVGSGAERATELLRQALAGDRPTSLEDVDSEPAKQEERKYRDRIRQRANEMGIRTAVRKFADIEADVIAQEEQAALAPEDRSAYALDLAGYNEQTPAVKSFLDDAFDPFDEAAEGQSVEAAMRSLGFTEEEINAELQAGKGAQEAEEADTRGTQGRDGSADARQADQGQGQQEGVGPKPNYAAGDRIVPELDVMDGDIVITPDNKQWMARVKRGRSIPVVPFENGKPIVSAETARRFDLDETVVTHTGTNFYGYGNQQKPTEQILSSYTNADIAQRESEQPTEDIKAQADRERDAVPFSMDMQSQAKPQGVQGGMFTFDGGVSEEVQAEQSPSDRFRAEVERRKQEREGTAQQAQEQPKQAEQSSAPAAQEAQPEQAESFPVNPELESLFESLDGTSTRKANKAKKAIQADPRADKINMVQDKFLDILQALEDSGAVKINCK